MAAPDLDYRQIFDSSPNPSLVLDRSLNIVGANRAYLAAARRDLADIVGRSAWDAFPTDPDTLKQSIASFERVIRTKEPDTTALLRVDVPRPEAEGGGVDERYWSITHTPILDAAGDVQLVTQQPIDVTELERLRDAIREVQDDKPLKLMPAQSGIVARAQSVYQANLALKAERDRTRQLLEGMDEGFLFLDSAFRVQEINTGALRLDQRPAADIIGRTCWQAWPGMDELPLGQAYRQAMQGGAAIHLEQLYRFADGRSYWLDCHVYPAEHGVAVFFRNINARKGRQQALVASERAAVEAARQAEAERLRLDAVLEATPVAIVVVDQQGAVVRENAANRRLWGRGMPSVHRASDYAHWQGWWADGSARHGTAVAPEEWTIVRAVQGGEALTDIIEIASFDQPPVRRTVLMSAAPIKDLEGATIGGVVAQMDITDRVKAEHALRQADRRKDEFLAMLAHELRNPLAPISAAADILGLGSMGDGQVRKTSAIIARQVRHMTGLIDDLLDVSRVTQGLVTLQKSTLDAKRIVADAVEQARPLLEARRHRLELRMPPQAIALRGDEKRLVQVLSNLLNNAAKYTPEEGHIVLGVETDDSHVAISVEDNGIGMDQETLTHAFQLFAQAERTPDRSQGGLGLGLALVRSIIELHGGTVCAHSNGAGKGSTFTVRLPLAHEGPALPAESAAGAGATLTILIADDNADAARTLAMFLEALGHRVAIAFNAGDALREAQHSKPDICVLDIGLPDFSGLELARRLRHCPETASATLVAVTGYGQEQNKTEAVQAGFDHYFVKPIETEQLARTLVAAQHWRHTQKKRPLAAAGVRGT